MISSFRVRSALPALLLTVLGACAVNSLDDDLGPSIEDTAFAPILGIDLAEFTRTASGLYINDVVEGEGDAAFPGDSVRVNVQGWLPNGTVFQPPAELSFRLASGVVIPGFDEGVTAMRQDGNRVMIVPSELGYRSGGNPDNGIPGNSHLVFEVDMLEIYQGQ